MVTAGFCIAAVAMVGGALGALLWPLLRRRQHAGEAHRIVAALLAVALPLASAGLYRLVGDPAALAGIPVQAAAPTPGPDATALALQRWLDRADAALQAKRSAEARAAYAQALRIAPDASDAVLGWVEADMAQQPDFAVGATARGMLERLLAQQPDNQRALWMCGIGEFQQRRYAQALTHWRRLQSLLPDASPLRDAVAQKIAAAEAMAAAPAQAPNVQR